LTCRPPPALVLAGVHEIGKLGPAGTQLFGDLVPCFARMFSVGLFEGLADRGGDDNVLAARDMGPRVAHPVNAAPSPGPEPTPPRSTRFQA